MQRSAPLGRLLLDTGVLTQVQLDEILVVQRNDRRRLGELLVERQLVNPIELAQLLSTQLSCPWISLSNLELEPDVVGLLPEELVLDHGVVPVHLRITGGQKVLYVATDDPTDEVALAECAAAAGMPVRPMVAVTGDVRDAIARLYGTESLPDPTLPRNKQPQRSEKPKPPPLPLRAHVKKPDSLPNKAPAEAPPKPVSLLPEDVVELAPDNATPKRAPTVLALNAPDEFLAQCRAATASLGATLVDGGIVRAGDLVKEHRPCAIIVTEDVYSFDRSGLNRLALDNEAHLVVWSEEVDGHQLEPLLAGAINRWGRSSYEKGSIIDGRYELLRDLGGSRWEVRNTRTARRSVLAFAVRAEGDAPVAAIRAEQRSLARITHPGAIELRDGGTTELGDPYIVLEMLEGRTVGGLVAAKEKLHVDDVCAMIMQVADVLSAAHAMGVVHRHVIAENIVVVRDGYGIERVKLAGWGHAAIGEPDKVQPLPDLTALAMVAFEALAGRAPESTSATKPGEVPDPLMPLLVRALSPEGMPYASARDLALAFKKALPHARERTQLLGASPSSRELPAQAQAQAQAQMKKEPAGAEQRRYARAPYRTPVRIEVPGIGAIDGRSEDISIGGLLIVSRFGLKGGTEVTVRFALPIDGRVVSEAGIVKWLRLARTDETMGGRSALGIELTSISDEARRQIERYTSFLGDGEEID